MCVYIYIYIYENLHFTGSYIQMSDNCSDIVRGHVEGLRRKVLYHFAIVNKILIAKNCRKLILLKNNFLFKYNQLYRKTTRDKNCLFSSHREI